MNIVEVGLIEKDLDLFNNEVLEETAVVFGEGYSFPFPPELLFSNDGQNRLDTTVTFRWRE